MTMILDGTNGAFLPTWTTATRPTSPANGQIGYNSTTGQIDQYVGSAWSSVPTAGASQATATALGTVYAKQTTGGGSPYLTAYGYNAGVTNTTGQSNTFVGRNAGTTSNGNYNSFIGDGAGYSNTSGASNTAVGTIALFTNTTADNSTAVGYQAGYYQTGGTNTAVGSSALVGASGTSTGSKNTAVGCQAGNGNTSGSEVVAIGYQALLLNTSGLGNTAIGAYANYYNVTSSYNTAVGNSALGLSTGGSNTAVGVSALYNVTSGTANTSIGREAGLVLTTGIGNTYLGYQTTASGTSPNYEIVVGYQSTGKGSFTGFINPNTGGVYQGNNSTTWSTTSDQRLKKNIVDNNVGLDKISQIRVRNFEYRTEDEVTELPKHSVIKKEGVQLGAIAQEMFEILPDCVKTETTGVMGLNTDSIMWHMINAIKELNSKVIALEAKVGA